MNLTVLSPGRVFGIMSFIGFSLHTSRNAPKATTPQQIIIIVTICNRNKPHCALVGHGVGDKALSRLWLLGYVTVLVLHHDDATLNTFSRRCCNCLLAEVRLDLCEPKQASTGPRAREALLYVGLLSPLVLTADLLLLLRGEVVLDVEVRSDLFRRLAADHFGNCERNQVDAITY